MQFFRVSQCDGIVVDERMDLSYNGAICMEGVVLCPFG